MDGIEIVIVSTVSLYSQSYGFPVVMYGCEFEQTPEVGDGQGGLACCSPWGHKESDMTERLN